MQRKSSGTQPLFDISRDIFVIGRCAAKATMQIAQKYRHRLLQDFGRGYVESIAEGRFMEPIPITKKESIAFYQDMELSTEGGILATLYLLARKNKAGLRIYLREIPFYQETIEICEYFSLNPYRLFDDSYLLFYDRRKLETDFPSLFPHCTPIGYFTKSLDKLLVGKSNSEYLNRPERDEIYKLFRTYPPEIENGAFCGDEGECRAMKK